MHIKTTTLLLLLLASGLSNAQTSPGGGGVFVLTRDARPNTNEVASAPRTKLNISARFVRLPEPEAASFWKAALPASSAAGQVGMATLSEIDTQKQIVRWKALSGASMVTQLSLTTLDGFSTEILQPARQTQAGSSEPGAFFRVTPRVDPNDHRRIHLDFTAGITNSSGALAAVEKFSGSTSLWDGQTIVLPCETEKQPAEKTSGPRLLLLVCPVTIND